MMGALAVRFRDLAVDPADMATGPWADRAGSHAPRRAGFPRSRRRSLRTLGSVGWSRSIRDVIATIPDFYDATEPRLAHGDFVPVNVLLAADGSLAGVLDLGSWRIAHPWLDVAWWGVVVATFHRDAWVTAWPSLLSASGVPGERDATATIRALQVLRSLESAATRNDPAALRLLGTAIAQQIEP